MEKNDGLQKLIEKIEDHAVIDTLIQQAVYNLRHEGSRPMIPILNDAAMMDLLSELFDAAFSTKAATSKKTNNDRQDESRCTMHLRGPWDWSALDIGRKFIVARNEKYVDSVVFGENIYICKKSHTKTKDNYPGSKVDKENGYWKLFGNIIDDINSLHFYQNEPVNLEYTGNKTVSNNKPTPFDLV